MTQSSTPLLVYIVLFHSDLTSAEKVDGWSLINIVDPSTYTYIQERHRSPLNAYVTFHAPRAARGLSRLETDLRHLLFAVFLMSSREWRELSDCFIYDRVLTMGQQHGAG